MSQKITDNEECIKDILYRPPTPPPKPPRYISIHHDRVRSKKQGKPCATMGLADIELDPPRDFLKKKQGFRKPDADPQKRCCSVLRKPILPKQHPSTGKERPKSNFVKENISSAKMLKPKSADRYVVDSPYGHKFDVTDTDLKHVYSMKFGSTPRYLKKMKEDTMRLEEEYRKKLENKEPLCKIITHEERQELLNGLKCNWNHAHKALLCLPLMIDTITKINKKKKIEDTLKQLEKSIEEVESNRYIYVYDD